MRRRLSALFVAAAGNSTRDLDDAPAVPAPAVWGARENVVVDFKPAVLRYMSGERAILTKQRDSSREPLPLRTRLIDCVEDRDHLTSELIEFRRRRQPFLLI